MIDMSALYGHSDYQKALDSFNSSHCKWRSFQEVQMKVSKNRCPICEYIFNDSEIIRENKNGENLLVPTVDHYRPKNKKLYPFLKCDHKNYLLMCFDCNSLYKDSKFPLYNSTIRATNKDELINEKPLIVNPINDDIYELFILVFKERNKSILELKPKASSGYLYHKALKTIEIFGLGNCEEYRHLNDEVHNCRIELLVTHFGKFYELARIMKSSKKDEFKDEIKEKIKNSSGFLQFIAREQFEIIEV